MKSSLTKHQLKQLQVRPSKERGQNFVIDPAVIDQIVGFAPPQSDEDVVEVGPGLGALTQSLTTGRSLTLIEIEKSFCEPLAQKFPSAKIINNDVRFVDFSEIGSELVVFGNLPYVFSTDIIFHLVANAHVVKRAVLLLQREFAERVAAPPGGRDYGVLSVMAQLSCDVTLGPIVPPTAFHPAPKVDSRVLGLHFLKQPRVPVDDVKWFRRVVQAAFHMRRKKIHNSLRSSGLWSGEEIDHALDTVGIDKGRRAETVSITEYGALAEVLRKK